MQAIPRSFRSRGLYSILVFILASGSAQSQSLTERAWIWTSGTSVPTCLANTDCAEGLGIYGAVGVYGTLGVPNAANTPGSRSGASTWIDKTGNLWLFGGDGIDTSATGYLNDLWKFNPSRSEWTWMGGSTAHGQSGVYGTLGIPAPGNTPGARTSASSWTDKDGNLWLFGGFGLDADNNGGSGLPQRLNDLWEYQPSIGQWAWKSGGTTIVQPGVYGTLGVPAPGNVPGGRRAASSWIDANGNFWLFGGEGFDTTGIQGELNDLWEFAPSTGEWVWVSGDDSSEPTWAVNWPADPGAPGVYGTLGVASPNNVPGGRDSAVSWIDSSGNLWLFGGNATDFHRNQYFLNDLWMFSPSTLEWTWMGGSSSEVCFLGCGEAGVYGTLGVPDAQNVPGGREEASAWTDAQGNFWLFGGLGALGELNDLWEYNPATQQWAWMGGSNIDCSPVYYAYATGSFDANSPPVNGCFLLGIFGTLGTPSAANVPSIRAGASTWIDTSGDLWLFGGVRYEGLYGELWYEPDGNVRILNDLLEDWEFQAPATTLPAATPVLSAGSGNYISALSVSIWDATPGATIYFTVDDSAPTASSAEYSDAIPVNSTMTIEAIALAPGYAPSAVASATYTYAQAAPPQFSPVATSYPVAQTVTLTDTTPGAVIHYTIDGSTPTSSSAAYSSPIPIHQTITVKAIAVAAGYADSAVASGTYTITLPPNQWVWMGGSEYADDPSEIQYGTLGVPAAGNQPGPREKMTGWTDASGNFWMFGGAGYVSPVLGGFTKDLWEFNPVTNWWAWMSGSATASCHEIAINGAGDYPGVGGLGYACGEPGIYGTLGTPSQENVPGSREGFTAWTGREGKLWLFGGYGFDADASAALYLNDLWQFDPATGEWGWVSGGNSAQILTTKTGPSNYYAYGMGGVWGTRGAFAPENVPSGRSAGYQSAAATWVDKEGNLWFFSGEGPDANNNSGFMNDMWEFNPGLGQWAWIGGSNTLPPCDVTTDCQYVSQPGNYGVLGVPDPANYPPPRTDAVSWTDSAGNFWLFGGARFSGYDTQTKGATSVWMNDLWEFNPYTRLWTWIGGNSTYPCQNLTGTIICEAEPVYGTLGVSDAGNNPGSRFSAVGWTDASGDAWLFGGGWGAFNDLWEFDTFTRQWTWFGGNNNQSPGVYGTLGVPASGNVPGGRDPDVAWTDKSGDFWLFGGLGFGPSIFNFGDLNDLWEYRPALPAQAAIPAFSVQAGTYDSPQSVMLSDATAGATIYYTMDGTPPTESSPQYAGSIAVNSTQVIEAIAVAGGKAPSSIAAAHYTIAPGIAAFSSASVAFGFQAIGTTSAPEVLTLRNSGTGPLSIVSIAANGDFAQTNTCGNSVVAKGSCTISITFAPSASGVLAGELAVTDNDSGIPGSAQIISLSGTGAAQIASLSPGSLMFDGQLVKTSSAGQSVTLSTAGNSPLTIGSFGITGDFSQTNNCSNPLPAGGSCAFNVVFKPTTSGARTGTLTITDNSDGAPGTTQTVNLSGTGQDFTMTTAAGSSASATVTAGATATFTLAVNSLGGLNQPVSFTCADAPSKAACTVLPGSLTLGNSQATITVTITTTAATTSASQAPPRPSSRAPKEPYLLALLFPVVIWAGRLRRKWFLAGITLLLMFAVAGCGGGSSGGGGGGSTIPGTPAGTYTLPVTGTTGSGASSVSHSVNLTLIVS